MHRSYIYGGSDPQCLLILEMFLISCEGHYIEPEELASGHVIEVIQYEEASTQDQDRQSISSRQTQVEQGRNSSKELHRPTALTWGPGRVAWYTVNDSQGSYVQIPELGIVRSGQLTRSLSVLLTCDKHGLKRMYEINVLCPENIKQETSEQDMTKDDFLRAWRTMFEYIQKHEREERERHCNAVQRQSKETKAETDKRAKYKPSHSKGLERSRDFKESSALTGEQNGSSYVSEGEWLKAGVYRADKAE